MDVASAAGNPSTSKTSSTSGACALVVGIAIYWNIIDGGSRRAPLWSATGQCDKKKADSSVLFSKILQDLRGNLTPKHRKNGSRPTDAKKEKTKQTKPKQRAETASKKKQGSVFATQQSLAVRNNSAAVAN